MNGIRFHDVSVRYFSAILAVAFSACLYSCSGGSKSTEDSSQKSKIPLKKAADPSSVATNPGAKTADAKPSFHFVKPAHVKGLYWTAWTAGSTKARNKLLDVIDHTELNAVVVDIRDEGQVFLKTKIKLADESKGTINAIAKPYDLLAALEKHKVWPIARIACFRDSYVPKKFPELGIKFANGTTWRDKKRFSWLDPYNKKNWEYIGEVVDYALDLGFPEIQLDYVRFPSEGKASSQVFPAKKGYAKAGDNSADVIADFAKFIGEKVHKRNAVFSVDIFGIISSTKGDEGIGQQLEKVAEPFDVLSPMIYPSHFARGEYGIANPNASPYEIIKKSLNDYKKRLPKTTIRPWLQAFSLGVKYGAPQLKAQIKAARDVGYKSFLLWNASNKYPYVEAALSEKKDPE